MPVIKLIAVVMIVSVMLGAGLQVDLKRLREVLRDYGVLARALLVNFVLVPLFAFVVVQTFHVHADVATGILLMSMAPGVPFIVNTAGKKQGGSLELVLMIAFCFTALSVVTVPLTMKLLLPGSIEAELPAWQFLQTLLLFQLLPLAIGVALASRLNATAASAAAKVMQLIFLVATLGFVVLAFPRLAAAVSAVAGFGRLVIILGIGVFSLVTGWLAGGANREYRRSLSIATTMRNIGLCALIGTNSVFEGTLVLPTILSYFIVTMTISFPLAVAYGRVNPSLAP